MKPLQTIQTFAFPTEIRFGPGVIAQLSQELKKREVRSPFVVADPGVARQDFFGRIIESLKENFSSVPVFKEISPNPKASDVLKGAAFLKETGADIIIAIGGGSPIDAAKGIALSHSAPHPLMEYKDGNREVPQNILPIVAIPTTAGTGSEVGRSTVISEDDTRIKRVIFSPHLLPKLVLADPELTYSLPKEITAATGMDALTHNVEAYLSKGWHPICDAIALEGTRLVAENLEIAARNGFDEEARANMLISSMMGAIAFQKGLGATHSMAHPLTTLFDIPHGLANAICLTAVLKFNAEIVEDRIISLARHIRLPDESPEGFIRFVSDLKKKIGIPVSLRELGLKEDGIQPLVELALEDGCHLCNPRPVTREDFYHLYQEVF